MGTQQDGIWLCGFIFTASVSRHASSHPDTRNADIATQTTQHQSRYAGITLIIYVRV